MQGFYESVDKPDLSVTDTAVGYHLLHMCVSCHIHTAQWLEFIDTIAKRATADLICYVCCVCVCV